MRAVTILLRASLAAVLCFGPLSALGEIAVPPLAARVTDLTATLAPAERAALESKLATFERRKGSQIAVLLVPTTQPETIEQYSIRVVDRWMLGRKDIDDGVLLLVAKNDRELRIEVGRGLEGALPDATARRIIDEHITPAFKRGDFAGGVNAGVDRIIQVIDGEPLPEAPPRRHTARPGIKIDNLATAAVLVLLVGGVLRSVLGLLPGSLGAGALAGAAAGFLGTGIGGSVLLGFAASVFCLIGLSWLSTGGSRLGSRSLGGRGGGGFGSGGFGGGGFRGGGGGFGGGGASGRW